MKNLLKKILAIFAASLMMFSFSTNAFADNKHFDRKTPGRGADYFHTLRFTKWGSDTVTIVNTGKAQLKIDTQASGFKKLSNRKSVSSAYLWPGQEISFAYSSNSPRKLWIESCSNQRVSYRIKTTSGTIS